MDKKEVFKERQERFIKASNHQEPDRVPILSQLNTYAMGFCKKTTWDIFKDPALERECYQKANEAFYFDGLTFFGLNHPFQSYFDLGSETYMVAENNVTIQHKESSHMKADEYDEFINNPLVYLANKTAPSKVKAFCEDSPKDYQALVKLFESIKDFKQNAAENRKFVTDVMGYPIVARRSAPHPLDNFFDYIRGFRGTLSDIRRMPEKVEQAVFSIEEYYSKSVPSENESGFPWLMSTCHIPTFLSKAQFERFYFPFFKRCVLSAAKNNTKFMVVMEGKWEQHFDLLEELPKGALLTWVEKDDIVALKKRMGEHVTIMGGLPLSMLKYSSVDECIDYTKRLFDTCALGGGFIFSTDLPPLGYEDLNEVTYRKVNEFAHEYGKY